ncbi:N-acetyllactosaminide beta-1,3-N-acetylglucosaminyltransferase 3 [Latimeria chalumnae]|uniref:N-acetyllactosaminide beta-1,3-N-acetylglucosaminyltransferase 3 n=1 Tax=Latimeria chalumnae TaxID=7897 RepID=UPI0003C123FB|nr:PREDICTED: N-acetyllactosaminide beta-1,3-N-acetylglucosaminyltransferase 3 [Latimeria chalumnae]|eukprot:XP_006014547.1 PREDICTED: N-acetyllactosaminide beta-1,3-N-acetylglucosaminyltransferase 3 [Latimeria chalumnae]
MRWRHHILETFLLLVVGTFGLAFLLQGSTRTLQPNKLQTPKVIHSSNIIHHSSHVKLEPIPKCTENTSVVKLNGFSDLPDHIKDFLRYRHCKKFRIIQDSPNKCGSSQDSNNIFLLLVIKSSPGNYERRDIIRKTWGEERVVEGAKIRLIFTSGVSPNRRDAMKLNKLLQMENEQYRDILQWDFYDTFFNLTLKQVLFYEWFEQNCPHARFLLNGDDDVFANTDNMVQYLSGLKEDNNGDKHLFVGTLIMNVGPIREKWSKYYIPEQVTKSKSYPPYCGGGGLLMSCFTARTVYKQSLNIELFPIDDVYLGMCLERAGLIPNSHMGIRTAGLHAPSSNVNVFDPCFYRELLLVHRFVPYETLLMWKAIHDPTIKCAISLKAKH